MRENRRPVTARHNLARQKMTLPLSSRPIGVSYQRKQTPAPVEAHRVKLRPTPICAQPVSGGLSNRLRADSDCTAQSQIPKVRSLSAVPTSALPEWDAGRCHGTVHLRLGRSTRQFIGDGFTECRQILW